MTQDFITLLMLSALMPDCLCGHACACHLTGLGWCSKRVGWKRKRCLCRHYEPPGPYIFGGIKSS